MLLGNGIHIEADEFAQACQEYVRHLASVNDEFKAVDDPVKTVDELSATRGCVIIRKLHGHPRARYEVVSRRKKTGLTDLMLTRLESVFTSLAPDDVVLWKMRLHSQGELAYAGVVFYGESDILSSRPDFEGHVGRRKTTEPARRLGSSRGLR